MADETNEQAIDPAVVATAAECWRKLETLFQVTVRPPEPEFATLAVQRFMEAHFVHALAKHANADVSDVAAELAAVSDVLKPLVQTASGWALLADAMTLPGTPLMRPALH